MLPRVRVLPSLAAALGAAVCLSTSPADAVAPSAGHARKAVQAAPAAGVKAPLRDRIDVRASVPAARAAAWDAFRAAAGGRWQATWDRATDVPSRIWGGSIHVPGSSRSAQVAETAARGFLARHLALVAPGADLADLELVTNHTDGRVRTVAFVQRHGGLRVVGGQVSVRFLDDRLYLISSQILPDVAVAPVGKARAAADVVEAARADTARELGLASARAARAGDLVIVPLVADDAVLGYRVAQPVDVEAGATGRWTVYADPATGAPVVRHDRVLWASGTLVYDVPVRYPAGGRGDFPAGRAHVVVDGGDATTDAAGVVSWVREQTVPLVTSVTGAIVAVDNRAGDLISATLSIAPGGTARWSEAADALHDAQLSTFVHTHVVKEYVRVLVDDPEVLAWLDEPMPARVNLDDECNAFYTDGTINFFQSSEQCENTGRLADVVYHEFGHALHHRLVILGSGIFDGAMSEGASDFLAALITADPGMGRGFFYTEEALRHLDPEGTEAVWPRDIGEVHKTGLIYGGAFWDLRTAAIAALGEEAGLDLVHRLFLASLRHATDIPSALIEALAADDDDGDLGNGTPNECLIREAFGRHGLRTVTGRVSGPGRVGVADAADATTAEVSIDVAGISEACPGDEIVAVEVLWDARHDSASPDAGTAPMTIDGASTWRGAIALPDPGDVVEYRVRVEFADGTSLRFPDNAGDPDYEVYRGDVVELYCTDFEADPFDAGWTHGAEAGDDLWYWGGPGGLGGDPDVAFSGASLVGMAPDGVYAANSRSWAQTPVVDVGDYSDVRLQFRRWLGVEDGYYDKATIYANGEIAWQNFDSGQALSASTHTRDREWVFRDVPLSTRITDGTVEVRFALTSDGGLEFGGWHLDDLCIVADPTSICGDGVENRYEQCDDGAANADAADACRLNCRVPVCGDGIVDSREECDDGNRADGDACTRVCTLPGEEGGCCSSSSDPRGAIAPLALLGAALAIGARRRRRRAS